MSNESYGDEKVGVPLVIVRPLLRRSHTNRATRSVTSSSRARRSSSSSVVLSFAWSVSTSCTTEGVLKCLHIAFKAWIAQS
ncbi:hypothetical protein M404DRAFT_256773 [Pisolithus tinctorius Marx 270]|uniref:Uncharacterized protein n=1 Tax=Pisolithus tinctorius Marx 270 TaxID=870435 RepID=A0A0C3JET7_PISTI|nr:hypothetical protein M404DRAFT_256773 [Pisolithus tinctorius Marx 270]